MESNYKTEELKKIFFFLAGKEVNQENLKLKTEDIIYGLDQYGLKMNQKKKDDLKNALINKEDNDGNIHFEDFKECFDLKKKDQHKKTEEIKNTANQIYFLIQEILGPEMNKEQKLSKENVKQIFEIVFCLDEVDDEYNKNGFAKKNNMHNKSHISNNNYSQITKAFQRNNKQTPTPSDDEEDKFARELKKEFKSEKNNFAKMLLDSIDLDGDGLISLTDFEFLIKTYFSSKG